MALNDNLNKSENKMGFPIPVKSYKMILIGLGIILLGFVLMMGSGSTDEAYNPDIFSTRRIIVGPTIAFLGFIFMGVGIIYRSKKEKADNA